MFFCVYHFSEDQPSSNFAGFLVAVTFSFFANARWTFREKATGPRYLSLLVFMGAMSWGVGFLGDAVALPPVLTVAIFSCISLVIGYFYSKFIVFQGGK